MTKFYGRQGQRLSLEEWLAASDDISVRRVAQTVLPRGAGTVTTVWNGYHPGPETAAPQIFESTVFSPSDDGVMVHRTYSTEAEALAGHEEMVLRWRDGLPR